MKGGENVMVLSKKDSDLIDWNKMDKIREARGWSVWEFCKRSDMQPAVLYRLRQGQRSPNLRTLSKLAKGLGIGISELFVEGNFRRFRRRPAVREDVLYVESAAGSMSTPGTME